MGESLSGSTQRSIALTSRMRAVRSSRCGARKARVTAFDQMPSSLFTSSEVWVRPAARSAIPSATARTASSLSSFSSRGSAAKRSAPRIASPGQGLEPSCYSGGLRIRGGDPTDRGAFLGPPVSWAEPSAMTVVRFHRPNIAFPVK